MIEPLLEVEDLSVTFRTPHRLVQAVRDISFTVGREKVGIVGESGSGKSATGRAILKLTPGNGTVTAKRMRFEELDLAAASESDMLKVRGSRIGMILQDPKFSLAEALPPGLDRREARARVLEMLEAVHIRNPQRVYDLYPHECSGGMGQRVMIAMMLVPEPKLLIADEPTSALDVTVRMQVLAILDDLVSRRGLGLMFISHDLNLVATFCDRVLIMYAGRIVEQCKATELRDAKHPYTQGLLASLPRIGERRKKLATLVRYPAWAM
jgi:peptide/nickel transport system ATP-binding protein